MAMQEEGIEGEQKLGRWLRSKGYRYFQPDAISLLDGQYVVWECKMKKEAFKPPPFYGHGLEIYKIEPRLKFCKDKGFRCALMIFELKKNVVLWEYLDVLEMGEKFDTRLGLRIYPLENFNIEEFEE